MRLTTSEIDRNRTLVNNSTTDTHQNSSNSDLREIEGCTSDSNSLKQVIMVDMLIGILAMLRRRPTWVKKIRLGEVRRLGVGGGT